MGFWHILGGLANTGGGTPVVITPPDGPGTATAAALRTPAALASLAKPAVMAAAGKPRAMATLSKPAVMADLKKPRSQEN